MIGIVVAVEGLTAKPPNVVNGNAGAAKDVLPDRTGENRVYNQVAYRFIQNVGNGNVSFALAIDCDGALNVHGTLQPGQQLSVPSLFRVSVFGVAAWSVATLELVRTSN